MSIFFLKGFVSLRSEELITLLAKDILKVSHLLYCLLAGFRIHRSIAVEMLENSMINTLLF